MREGTRSDFILQPSRPAALHPSAGLPSYYGLRMVRQTGRVMEGVTLTKRDAGGPAKGNPPRRREAEAPGLGGVREWNWSCYSVKLLVSLACGLSRRRGTDGGGARGVLSEVDIRHTANVNVCTSA